MQPLPDANDRQQRPPAHPLPLPTNFSHFQPQPLPLNIYPPLPAQPSQQHSFGVAPSALSTSASPPVPSFSLPVLPPSNTSPALPYAPARLSPPDHQSALAGAVDSARWSGDLPSLETSPVSLFSPALPLPPVSQPLAGPSYTVGQAMATFSDPLAAKRPSLSGPSGRAGGGAADFEAESIVAGPTGVQSRVKPFISKLNHMLSRPETYADVIVWDAEGQAFIVHHTARFHDEVLPRLFGHSQSASFSRQLNVYGFRRLSATELSARIDVASTANYSGWIHPIFKRSDRASLHLLTPRPSRARANAKEEKERKKALAMQKEEEDRLAAADMEGTYGSGLSSGSRSSSNESPDTGETSSSGSGRSRRRGNDGLLAVHPEDEFGWA
ncbi:hypothetical protein JCM8547_005777 [Rhodosporidiobolus lusitaniae]